MSIVAWVTQCSGGIAFLLVLCLSFWVLTKEAAPVETITDYRPFMGFNGFGGRGFWTIVFAYYCLAIHVNVICFSTRSCWGIWDMIIHLRDSEKAKLVRGLRSSLRRPSSAASLSSSETLTSAHVSSPSSSTSSDAGDFDMEKYSDDATPVTETVIHAIVIPNYKEEIDTLTETLDVLASHPQARDSYDIYLGMEQREINGDVKAMSLIQAFVKRFRSIAFTMHPSDIPGESAGKGSNVAWAARELSRNYSFSMRKNVIVTGIDADSLLSTNFFDNITRLHLAHPDTATTTMYCCPIIFDRNAHSVPAVVRVADILWSAGGISGLYKGSSIAPPTSVYSLPLELIDRVGGWDCGSEAIGEDLHMYLKCFFALNGRLTTRTIYSPVSQSNVVDGTTKGARGVYLDMRARYKQALRHMWGALDSGYAMRKMAEIWRNRNQTTKAFRPLHASLGDDSDLGNSIDKFVGSTEQQSENGIYSEIIQDTLGKPDWARFALLFHRLFEAHFLPLQMMTLIFASTFYIWLTEGNGDPYHLGWIFTVCNVIRIAGFLEIALYVFLYEFYHRICVQNREREMTDAGLARGMTFSHRNIRNNYLDYVMVPLVAPLYGSIPTLQAQICHFWTQDLVYTVSKKVTRERAKSLSADSKV
jgi:hypothetical protein